METYFRKIKHLTLIALFSDNDLLDMLVLKGGSALEFYDLDYRLSIDLDFSIEKEFPKDLNAIKMKIETALKTTFQEAGYEVFDVRVLEKPKKISPEMADFWGGYSIDFKIIEIARFKQLSIDINSMRREATVIGTANRRKIMIDVSKYEYCRPKQDTEVEGHTIYIYTSTMIVCEKIRAICQQMPEYKEIVCSSSRSARARDLYDIYILIERYNIDLTAMDNLDLLKKIFAAKRVPLNLLAKFHETKEFHREDFVAVKATVGGNVDLKDYDFYFDYVAACCQRILDALRIE